MTRYFVDAAGKYLGGFDGYQPPERAVIGESGKAVLDDDEKPLLELPAYVEPEIPRDAIEVPFPPEHGLDRWDAIAGGWISHPRVPEAKPVDLDALVKALVKKGVINMSDIEEGKP